MPMWFCVSVSALHLEQKELSCKKLNLQSKKYLLLASSSRFSDSCLTKLERRKIVRSVLCMSGGGVGGGDVFSQQKRQACSAEKKRAELLELKEL